jgi:hypothetical protein
MSVSGWLRRCPCAQQLAGAHEHHVQALPGGHKLSMFAGQLVGHQDDVLSDSEKVASRVRLRVG